MNALELRNLTKRYSDFQLEGLDLTLPEGCILGFIGENGAGKSTTMKLILNMIARDGGTVEILGRDNRVRLEQIKEDVGVVLDEVGIPGCLTAAQVGKIMRDTFRNWDDGLYERYLKQLELPRDKTFQTFSRGMKMKLGIAAALSHHARLLLLDEPTNALDPVAREQVVDLFGEFTREADHAVLISSHIVSDLEKICDYVAFLHRGKLLLCEEKDRLLEQYGVLHCTEDQLSQLRRTAVVEKKSSPYGVEAVVRRDMVGRTLPVAPVSLEELFVAMVKEAG